MEMKMKNTPAKKCHNDGENNDITYHGPAAE